MDIEGSELPALCGAKKSIVAQLPKLQICIYHKPDDFLSIPKTIDSFSPEYRFFIGHHSQNIVDTVLYATARK
jgi:hypothetical protein